MLYKLQYNSSSERENILTANANLFLVEEQNISEGNFLIFSDVPVEKETIYVNVPEKEFTDLKNKLATSQEAIDFLLMGGM